MTLREWAKEKAEKLFFLIEECKNHPMECMRVKHLEEALLEAASKGREDNKELLTQLELMCSHIEKLIPNGDELTVVSREIIANAEKQ